MPGVEEVTFAYAAADEVGGNVACVTPPPADPPNAPGFDSTVTFAAGEGFPPFGCTFSNRGMNGCFNPSNHSSSNCAQYRMSQVSNTDHSAALIFLRSSDM